MNTYTVKMIWEDGYWHTSTEAPLCLTLESESYDNLVERVRVAAPEMIEMNSGYNGSIRLIFTSERTEILSEEV